MPELLHIYNLLKMKKTVNKKKSEHVLGVQQSRKVSEDRYKSYIELTGQLAWVTNQAGEVVEDIPSFRNFTGQNLRVTASVFQM